MTNRIAFVLDNSGTEAFLLMNNNGGKTAHKASEEGRREDTFNDEGPVDVHKSESGSDPEVGHTPGKAEGVTSPEQDGNE